MQQGCKKETISISWGRTSNLEDHLSEEVVVSNPPLRSFGKGTTPDIDWLTLNFSPLINWDDPPTTGGRSLAHFSRALCSVRRWSWLSSSWLTSLHIAWVRQGCIASAKSGCVLSTRSPTKGSGSVSWLKRMSSLQVRKPELEASATPLLRFLKASPQWYGKLKHTHRNQWLCS